jgi:hypothetical protein
MRGKEQNKALGDTGMAGEREGPPSLVAFVNFRLRQGFGGHAGSFLLRLSFGER